MSEWIDAQSELPAFGQPVLIVFRRSSSIDVAWRWIGNFELGEQWVTGTEVSNVPYALCEVSHWMPLPELPAPIPEAALTI